MKIAVLSRNAKLYSTRRLIEAALKRGHQVEVIDHLKCAVVNEKSNPEVYYNRRVLDDFDAVIPRIGASVTMYGAAVVRQFETMNVYCANNSQSIVRSRDKLRTTQILSMEGIGIPRTAFAHDWVDVDSLMKSVGGPPVIIKLLEGTQGLGVVLAETKKAATSVIEAFRALEANILVQEFIAEAKGADIRAFVVDGHVVGSMIRQGPDGEFRSNLHRGGSARVHKLSREERITALRAAKVLGLVVAGVDMLQSARGPLVMEVNSSPGLEGIEGATGVDIAGRIIECVEKYGDKGRGKDKIKL
jgi:ribosomal protein S6--L-glutamate ligase